jgi:UDP-2,4-diacetamido-2,4,6-trideoxy-beta-L-altropyranose hydrolase
MRIALRADASRQLGWGHVKRCLALALALRGRGAEVEFVAARTDVDVAALVGAAGIATTLVSGETALPAGWAPDLVVVDHYRLGADWHAAARAATGAPIVVIDDLADRPLDAELVIDQNPMPDMAAKYRAALRRPARLCGGPQFALLDPVYAGHARHTLRRRVRSIGLFMGGTDAENFSAWAWQACRVQAGWGGPIEIASTRANPALAALQRLCADDAATTLLLDRPDLADFHARHDLQIGAGGGACWERCCLGVPALVLVAADNQLASVPHLAAHGAAVGLDARGQGRVTQDALGAAVRRLIDHADERRALHHHALALVDGLGAQRAAAEVLKCIRP